MAREYGEGARYVPLEDNPERQRFSFWRPHATPIPSELLEITGWLAETPKREVYTVAADGRVSPALAGARPANVLFIVPRTGSREHGEWAWALRYLRTEQSIRRLAKERAEAARVRLAAAERTLDELAEEFRQFRSALDQQEVLSVPKMRAALAEARLRRDRFDDAVRSRDIAAQQLMGQLDHERTPVLPFAWGRVNAFLDLQALSAASMASEEFRKTPRRAVAEAAEAQAALSRD